MASLQQQSAETTGRDGGFTLCEGDGDDKLPGAYALSHISIRCVKYDSHAWEMVWYQMTKETRQHFIVFDFSKLSQKNWIR